MLRTNVITPLARFFLPLSVAALFGLVGYGIFTGDMLGITLLLVVMVVAGFAGIIVSGYRVNDAAATVPADAPAPQRVEVVKVPLPGGGVWPFAAAVSVTLLLLGLVVSPVLAYFGLAVAAITAVGWLAQVSADMTGRQVVLLPLGLPVLGLCAIAATMFFVSRVLLAVPEQASTFIALMLAVMIMVGASLLALKPSIPAKTGAWMLGTSAVVLIARGHLGRQRRRAPHRGARRAREARDRGQGHRLRREGVEVPRPGRHQPALPERGQGHPPQLRHLRARRQGPDRLPGRRHQRPR